MSRLYARLRRAELEAERARAVRRALQVRDEAPREAESAGAEADRRRGIPIVGKGGRGGAIIGTRPGDNLR